MYLAKWLILFVSFIFIFGCSLDASILSSINDKFSPDTPLSLDLGNTTGTTSESPVFTWMSVNDDLSGVSHYEIKIVRQKDESTVVEWTKLESGSKVSSLSLETVTVYYALLRAVDNAGNKSVEVPSLPWIPNSDGCIGNMITDAPYAGGNGDFSSPYLLCTANQISSIINQTQDLAANFKLLADVNFQDVAFDGIGNNLTPFKGQFQGQGHTIKNLTIVRAAGDYVGFFNATNLASVSDLVFTNYTVTANGSDYIGGVAGSCYYSQFKNITLTNLNITGKSFVGGVIGETNACNLIDAALSGVITGSLTDVGGIIGIINEGGHCFNVNATVAINAPTASGVGGAYGSEVWLSYFQNINIVGQIVGGTNVGGITGKSSDGAYIYRSSFNGTITGADGVGGISGRNNDRPYAVRSASVNAAITGNKNVGGFAGNVVYNTMFEDSYVKATINGTGDAQNNFGGFWGAELFQGGVVSRSYADVTINSQATRVGGAIGYVTGINQISDSFVVSNVMGNSATPSLSLFIGQDISGAAIASNSYYISSGLCSNSGGGGCNTDEGIAQANIAAFYDPVQTPLSTWDFSNIWIANSGAFPTLNLNRYHTPSVSHSCNTAVMSSSNYHCSITVGDLDLNELQMIVLQPDHTCYWMYATENLLKGIPAVADISNCNVSFVVTDGVNSSPVQTFAVVVNTGISISPDPGINGYAYMGTQAVVAGAKTMAFTLTNHESATISNLTVVGLPGGPFDFAGGLPFPGSGGTCTSNLAAGASCTVVFSFDPTVIGTVYQDIELSFTSSKGNISYRFPLRGIGN